MTQAYTFILGGRVKNESSAIKEQILTWAKDHRSDGSMTSFTRADGTRLIVSYTEKRAKKDAYNRQKGLKKLRAKVASGRLTKTQITNRGYHKFLRLVGDIHISVDEGKTKEDALWDGLKGYLTTSSASPTEIVEQYANLWHIEQAFRISKTDLRVRPIFHRVRRRIEAHLCVVFVAYTIWKELERLLKVQKLDMSAKRAGELTQNMYEMVYESPGDGLRKSIVLKMDAEQQVLYNAVFKV